MISQTAEYALRAVVALAQSPEKTHTATEIARLTKVPEHYLSKVLHALAKAEVVRSQRGLHGGYVLAHSPDQLSLLTVINAVDPIKHIESCPLKLESHSFRGGRMSMLYSLQRRVTRFWISAFISIASGQGREWPSSGNFRVASIPIFWPTPAISVA